ncbi:acyl-CoA dehydrogenase C-terminal domain-containing protein [Luteimonas sp. BDR2-5]|uniref:acyl-CoA dehydrogenase C-terminal domain-containing protein n=1 Tax=Proluteimonas luteida TaxID=2878685 RepID=UPI001E438BC4|nr:acyl-CoA dehydrogenase C-terminal domain-containing protein [Luteimonas sp. BDR2-5]MCD9029395.1 acyl-CoA dehydrogenase C-terminal domain-containing protein [Luteimonas sp. BDR2-5]
MSTYHAPLTDIRFALHDVLQFDRLFADLGFEDANRETVDAVLDECARLCETVLAPLNRVGDEEGVHFDKATGDVTTPDGFKSAYRQFAEGGWSGMSAPAEFGGMNMPHAIGICLEEMIDAANLAWSNFPLLSHGAVNALRHHGEDWQKEVFLKPLIAGRWTGTMCLTEPHCGTDLGLLKTRAEPAEDGTYAITGTKIFITAGEHDLTDNIIHLVLARLPDAPAGSKGISLFIVPKVKVDRDGNVGARNALRCGAVEHKMGIHGSATCVMNFDGAQGYLIGQPHKGLMAMFTMMNTARLGVGVQGLGLATRAYENALRYARERLQSRALSGPKYPGKPADPIIVQPDVRRMLLTCKALTEGGRLLAYHAGSLVDSAELAGDAAARKQADDLLGFLTPIVKGCLTEWGNECTYHALQCFGGHGYIAEHGMEQLARDARITTLYEGTTGIQALDLMGRKTLQLQGAGLRVFLGMIEQFCAQHADNADLAEFIGPLREKADQWQQLTRTIAGRAAVDPEEIGAAAYDYLFYSGYVALAYWWARSVAVADASERPELFKAGKRETARFYFTRILPRTLTHAAAIESGPAPLLSIADEALDS